MVYEGNARPHVGTIEFTSHTSSWRLTDFSTLFSFIIDTQNQSEYGSGLAFFLTPVGFQIPVNSTGGFLGLFNTTYNDLSSNQIVGVEFDTFANPKWDPPYEHVGINKNSIALALTTPWNASFHSGDTADVWIVCNSTTKNLSISWSYQITRNRYEKTSISYQIDLTAVLPEEFVREGPWRFTYADLVSATNNFAEERKMGEGGCRAVYKGHLVGLDAAVAVKQISRGLKQGNEEFITEVKMINSLGPRNLVQLIGWCHKANEFLLVYAFMPNGSLNRHLFGKRRPLNSRFKVKLGDLGLARLMDHELGPLMTRLARKFGYLATEYMSTGRASKQSYVYSFGVVALEIVTGRRSVDPMEQSSQMNLVEWVWELHGKNRVVKAVDERLKMDFDGKQVERLLVVGLWCAHPDKGLRPSVRQALQALNFEIPVPVLPYKMSPAVYPVTPSATTYVPYLFKEFIPPPHIR
ncbi:hypothetical protein EUGRSUZ_H02417 [Eucalyptus grandis]|uniref:Uncharacterized protein n=2 Tax=Eucalyptus grandis TaxID=71139 RepID=A0ACC3JSV5_EUCGR|nr:hypothetical protein EUGRSUZ_H02417 [Eucalyptus grandis]